MMRCLASGLRTAGDDACVVTCGPPPIVRPMFGLAKLENGAAEALDGCELRLHDDDDGRPVVDLGDSLVDEAALRTIAITELAPSTDTTWSEITPGAAMRGLIDGSIAEGAGLSLGAIRRLVSTVRCVRLQLGSDPAGVVAAVVELAR